MPMSDPNHPHPPEHEEHAPSWPEETAGHAEAEEHAQPVRNEQSDFEKMLNTLEIPRNIDPTVLNLWLERERKVFDERAGKTTACPKVGMSLARVGMAYIGIIGMLAAILLGFLRGDAAELILLSTAKSLVFYGVIGYVAGLIAEHCIRESTLALAREVVERSDNV